MALTLSSTISTRRKGVIFGKGSGFLLARLAIAIAIPVASASNKLRSESSFGQAAEVVGAVFIDQPAMSHPAPMLAWWIGVAVTTRRATDTAPRERRTKKKSPSHLSEGGA